MPINDINHGLRRVGKLRLGEQVATSNGTRPSKLDTWRATSPDEAAVTAVADAYGGTPRPWDNDGAAEFEVITDVASLDVLLTPEADAFSQFYELWKQGGCQRRCDGSTESLSGGPCMCPADQAERSEEAKTGKACKATTRVTVVLPRVPALGSWMVESHGYYAARELGSTFALLDLAGARRSLLPARLRIEQRVSKKPGEKPNRYGVPVLDIAVSLESLVSGLPPAGVDPSTGEIGGPFDQPALEAPQAAPVTSVKKAAARRQTTVEKSAEVKGNDPISAEELAAFKARIACFDDQHRGLCAELMNNARVTLKTTPKKSEVSTIEQVLGAVEAKQAETWESRRTRVFGALGPLELSDEQRHQFVADATAGETESTKTLTEAQATAIIEAAGGPVEQQELSA